jgi:ParB family protein of integrating conjugative element (PFGI_1 class)
MSAQDRLPASVTVADAARKAQQRDLAQPNGTRTISPVDLRARLVKESLNVGLPLDNSHQLSIDTESQMTLPVMDITHYDKNPRKAINDQYDVIKESIRSTKQLTSPLVVTRRPGQEKYMVGKGGNTRLTALQELFSETGDAAFQYVVVTYTPWVSESSTLSAHLVENELRGEMIFWDKARAYADLKQMIESETGNALSARAFEQTLKERGLPLGKTTLSYFNFAVTHLAGLGEACKSLSRPVISELQPAFNVFERLLKHKQQIQAWPELRDQALKRAEHSWLSSRSLEPARVIEHLEHAVATKLGETVELVRLARQLCQQHPGEDIAGLVAQTRLQTEPASTPPLPPPNTAETSVGKNGNATERPENPAPAMPEQKPKTELLDAIQDLATRFARLTESADCLRLAQDWPTGFYMEVPENDEPIDLTENGADRYFGWWMLAMLSEQLDGAWSGSMPADSTWRQAQRQEHGRDEFALQHYMDTILGMPIDPLSLGKRLASASPSVPVWLELVAALRTLRGTAPERFAVAAPE